MTIKELMHELLKYPANAQVNISTSIFDENGIPATDVLLQEYDDGQIEYEVVIMGNYDYGS